MYNQALPTKRQNNILQIIISWLATLEYTYNQALPTKRPKIILHISISWLATLDCMSSDINFCTNIMNNLMFIITNNYNLWIITNTNTN